MVGAHRRHQPVLDQADEAQAVVSRPAGHQANREIEIAGADRRQHVGIDALEDMEAHARMRALEGDDRARQQAGGDARRGADADFAKPGALDRFDVVAGVAELRLDGLDAREQRLARLGRGHAVRAAMQELDTEVVFQLLDALGDRRLRQIENLGRLPDRAGLDHGGEIAQLTEFHGDAGRTAGDR